MRFLKTILFVTLASASIPACVVGDDPSPPTTNHFCVPQSIDVDGDGAPDGLDTNCDGTIDVPYNSGGGGSSGSTGGQSQCDSDIAVNGVEHEIICTSTGGGPEQCQCKVEGQLVSTCTTSSPSACSQPGNGNCCGF